MRNRFRRWYLLWIQRDLWEYGRFLACLRHQGVDEYDLRVMLFEKRHRTTPW